MICTPDVDFSPNKMMLKNYPLVFDNNVFDKGIECSRVGLMFQSSPVPFRFDGRLYELASSRKHLHCKQFIVIFDRNDFRFIVLVLHFTLF